VRVRVGSTTALALHTTPLPRLPPPTVALARRPSWSAVAPAWCSAGGSASRVGRADACAGSCTVR